MNQKEYEERMKDPHYRELKVTKAKDGKGYVFISYRGDSWKKVLSDIVYKLQKVYGLRIYFDKDFASETNVWIQQFQENMEDPKCKAFLCFMDEGYFTSYATLLELMHAMNKKSKLQDKIRSINFPFAFDKLSEDSRDTGLGKESGENPSWEDEKKQFDIDFGLLCQNKSYGEMQQYYYPEQPTSFRKCDCADIMKVIQPKNQSIFADNEAFYLQYIIEPLYQWTEGEVFEDKEKIERLINNASDPSLDSQSNNSNQTMSGSDKSVGSESPVVNMWRYTGKNADATLHWDGKSKCCTVLAGSRVGKEARGFATQSTLAAAKKIKDSLIAQGILVNDCFVKDYPCDKISTMINVLGGGSISMPGEIKAGRLAPIGDTPAQQPAEETPDLPVQPAGEPLPETPVSVSEPAQIKETPLIIPKTSNGTQTTATTPEPECQASCTMTLEDFVRKYNNSGFTKKSFDQVQLRTVDGNYVGEFRNSTRDLVWQFMMKLIADNGEVVMQRINDTCAASNPIFIPADQTSKYKLSYSSVDAMPGWAMCTNYSQPAWLVNLKKWVEAVGFDSRELQLEFKGFYA